MCHLLQIYVLFWVLLRHHGIVVENTVTDPEVSLTHDPKKSSYHFERWVRSLWESLVKMGGDTGNLASQTGEWVILNERETKHWRQFKDSSFISQTQRDSEKRQNKAGSAILHCIKAAAAASPHYYVWFQKHAHTGRIITWYWNQIIFWQAASRTSENILRVVACCWGLPVLC